MDTKKLRQKILDLAIHGKLVPQDPNDEPASVLLDRIREEKDHLIKEGKIKKTKSTASSDTSHYENVPFEVPTGWCWCTVEDVFELNPKNKVEDNVICGFIPMALVDDGFGYAHSFEERPWGEVKKGYCHFQNGDIGIAKISPCFENRKSTIFSGLPNGIGAGTTELSILRGSLVDCRFFLFLFQTEWYLREGTKYFKGVVGQQRVNKEIFTTLQIPLPPLAEQRRIANAIESYMSLCSEIDEYRDGVHSAIIASKAKILDLAIHGKLVPQDPNDEPASELLKRINPKAVGSCDNPHYEDIPESWVECKLGDVCSFESGYAYSSEMYKPMGIPLIRISNIVDGLVNIEDCVYIKGNELSKNVQVKQGDLLIAMSGATTGKIGIYAYPNDAILNQRVGNIRVKELSVLSTGYRDLFINAIKVEIEKKAYGGAQPNISGKMICDFSFSLPPYYEQLRIVSKVNELFSKLDIIEKSLQA